jgi:hypothetical protein
MVDARASALDFCPPRSDNIGKHSQLISIGKVIRNGGDAGASRYGLLTQEYKAVATGRRTSDI